MAPHLPREPAHPTDLSMPPPADRIIHIDTAPPSSSSNHHNADVAGVLRRNQACLQCRKRKLKCDAARPHCATCVRSYRHLLRTSPKSNPVLCCDYDDGAANHHDEGDKGEKGSSSKLPSHGEGPNEDDGGGKKKRKASGEGKRKKKDEEFEEERDRLTKKIEELQSQLSQNLQSIPQGQQSAQPDSQPNRNWSSAAQSFQDTLSASSPTAFLEMLSSAASSQNQNQNNNLPKSRNVSAQNPPDLFPRFEPFIYKHSGQQPGASISDTIVSPDGQSHESRRSSTNNLTPGTGGESSTQGENILSPGGVFNFSPGPTTNFMSSWPPAEDSTSGFNDGSNKMDGTWKATETIETVFTASMNPQTQQSFGIDTNMDTEINLDGLQAGLDAAMQQQLLMDMFWPGWPINLPEPNVVNDLIEAFFDLVPNLSRVLHRARFLSRMALPPTHSNFPHPALIHAVCAAAAAWCSPELYEKSVRGRGNDFFDTSGLGMYGTDVFEGKGSKANLTFGLRQASFAKDAVQEGLNTGNRLFDVVRAMIILCRVFIDDTRMLECWAYGGLVTRMLLPLGLNVRSAELSLKSVMLPPPADALEREERRAALWMAFYHDTIASAASGWGTSMQLDELTAPLPASFKDFETGHEHMESNPQDLESPDFWVKHPVQDSFVMVIKATVLMNRVNKFARRWKNRHMKPDDDFYGLNKPEFRELANAIACFQMSFPPSFRNVGKLSSKGKLDIDLIAAHMLPHAAIICLHEPFADLNDPSDQAARRMLGATQAIVSIVQQLASIVGEGGSNFTSIMHSSASVCLVTSARTSLLFLRHALNVNDMAAAQTHRTDCEMIRMALSQFGIKFKIGHHHSQLIEYFLDRATNPTYEKLQAHYPDHPRPGAPELTPSSNLGLCVINALNIKRGFWRLPRSSASTGASPFGSTPESMGSGVGSHTSFPQPSSTSSVSQHLSDADSPKHPLEASGLRGNYTFFDSFQKAGPPDTEFNPGQPHLHRNMSTEAMETDSPPTGSLANNQGKGEMQCTQRHSKRASSGKQRFASGAPGSFDGGADLRPLPEPRSDLPEYNFAGIAFPIDNSSKQQSTLSETGLCDMAPPKPVKKASSSTQPSQPHSLNQIPIERVISAWDGVTPVDTRHNSNNNNIQRPIDLSHPLINPVTKEMEDMITASRTVGRDGQIPIWTNTTEASLAAERQKASNKAASAVGKNGSQSGSTNYDISLPGVGPVTKEMEEKITQARRAGYVGDLGIWKDDVQQKSASKTHNPVAPSSNSATNIDNPLADASSTSREIYAKIQGKDTIGSDGQYPVWMNTTEKELLAEAQRRHADNQQQQQNRLNQYIVNDPGFIPVGNVEEVISSFMQSGTDGINNPFWSTSWNNEKTGQNQNQAPSGGSGSGSGSGGNTMNTSGLGGGNQDMNSSSSALNPEIEAKFRNIQTQNSDGHIHVIHNLTQEQIMLEINKNGNLPSDDQIGFKEGQKEQGRVGEMLRRVYE